jgi:hypothetical protein
MSDGVVEHDERVDGRRRLDAECHVMAAVPRAELLEVVDDVGGPLRRDDLG